MSWPVGAPEVFGQLDPQPLPVSKGVYRLPFADGTTVQFSNNHLNHPTTRNRIDMTGQPAGQTYTVVSAAAGWVRVIIENNDTNCPNSCGPNNDCDGDGVTTLAENNQAQNNVCGSYSGPATFCCERDYESSTGLACPSGGTCLGGANNLVWMEHPNGEWTKYTHMQRRSIGTRTDNNGNPGAGRVVGEYIPAGTPLGLQGDVGFASGPHVHFEVAIPNYVELLADLQTNNAVEADPDFPPATVADWFDSAGFLVGDGVQDDVIFEDKDGDGANDPDDDVNRQNRIPVFCQVGFAVGGDQNTAGPCDDLCNNASLDITGTIGPGDSPYYEQVSGDMGNTTGDFVLQANAGASIRAGGTITLSPGFHAELNSYFYASTGACDSPGGTGE